MAGMNPVTWFEIPVADMERAVKFYESVLGVKLSLNTMGPIEMAWFPMGESLPGSTGSLVKGESYTPSHAGTMVYFGVDDIEGTLRKAAAGGGKVLAPKMSIGEYGFVAHFQDSEGNRLALHSMS
jgi:hypothetical protein